MTRILGGLMSGLLFGIGLLAAGMADPNKVTAFLDIAGHWDPSLAFVIVGGVITTALGYRLVLKRGRPLFEPDFLFPTRTDIDGPLVIGAVLFGIGWGLGGYCPGPALVGLGQANVPPLLFVAAMLLGMMAARITKSAGGIK
ncbi:MAG: YeeE/YedE family protein [Rhodospirillaceae bacterium]|nr:YeeE/YedE family protein [Rhodospirillaceae bacterium]